MKLVHVVRQFHPSVGGLEDVVLNVASLQRREFGLNVQVVTLDRLFVRPDVTLPARETVSGIPVTRIPWRGSSRYPLAPSILKAIRGADLVHVHAIDFFFDFLALTRPLHGVPLIASTHGGFFHSSFASRAKKVFFQTVTRASCQAYRRIIACSEDDADLFRPIAGNRLTTIENGVDVDKFKGAGSPVPTRTILSYGRFARHKRIDLLFPLLAKLRTIDPTWRLIVAGREADVSLFSLHETARVAGVSDAVRFVLDPSNNELRSLMGEASYYASASEHEGFGIAAVEAMSAGLIPILSKIPPFRRLVERTGVGAAIDMSASDVAVIDTLEATQARSRAAMHAVSGMGWDGVARRYVSAAKAAAKPGSALLRTAT